MDLLSLALFSCASCERADFLALTPICGKGENWKGSEYLSLERHEPKAAHTALLKSQSLIYIGPGK
jgi:hypothetical protein